MALYIVIGVLFFAFLVFMMNRSKDGMEAIECFFAMIAAILWPFSSILLAMFAVSNVIVKVLENVKR